MRIYKMTATFGKLEHATLELKSGLNIITAPNEWGKSTWCAFLIAMLYGIDTRSKTTKTAIAEKERYAPWSGQPMSGRIDLNWNGRDITIERTTKRRVPMGEFQAYETQSGLPVSELTAANCGQMLLGVEQSVFRRAGFIRHADLAVTQDEALRRRLNALVTTGDDSGAADRLSDSLKELKNRCRYNRTGLLPQAEAQYADVSSKLTELETLEAKSVKLTQRLEELGSMIAQLRNHKQALAYAKMLADSARVAQAKEVLDQTQQQLQTLEEQTAKLPPRQETEEMVHQLRSFREQWNLLQVELRNLPQEPQAPKLPEPFTGMVLDEAWRMVKKDSKTYGEIAGTKAPLLLILLGILGIAAAGGLVYLLSYLFAAVAGGAGLIALIWGVYEISSIRKQTKSLHLKYGNGNYKHWADPVAEYENSFQEYSRAHRAYRELMEDVDVRSMVLQKKRDTLCSDQDPEQLAEFWQEALNCWDACLATRREAIRANAHYESLSAMLRPVEKPAMPDDLTHSEEETVQMLTDCTMEQQRLQNRLGQVQGRMEVLGDKNILTVQQENLKERIEHLDRIYTAVLVAQEALAAAKAELQRRYAPRITKQAQRILSRMTGGRYHSLIMTEDFSLQAGAGQENTLSDVLWRSDGTVDQLYLSLRLAVAQELTPEAPLILDDALVRFDDMRMKAAVEILRELAKEKQVILFTCQGREAEI